MKFTILLTVVFISMILEVNCQRKKSGRNRAGGWREIDLNSDEVKEKKAVFQGLFNDKNDDTSFFSILSVNSFKKQVVAGVKYKMNVDIVKTGCKKDEANKKLAECSIEKKEVVKRCDFTVWEQAWRNFIELKSSECSDHLPYDRYLAE